MRLSDFSALSFDCYGTLIDWETGILEGLRPLFDQFDVPPGRDEALAVFARLEGMQQRATPAKLYRDVLAVVYKRLAEMWERPAGWDECRRFGDSVHLWPAFPDSTDALRELQKHFKLVILSNVDNQSFAASSARLGIVFDAVFTAEDTGAYKPDRRGFEYMLSLLDARGIPRTDLLHAAQSLYHDHVTAAELGLSRCWIDRRAGRDGGATPAPKEWPTPDFRYESLTALAEAVRSDY